MSSLSPPPAGAGYNAAHFPPGRQEPVKGGDDGRHWDIYADFNNEGPRYSRMGMGSGGRTILSPSGASGADVSAASKVEIVTVPAMGAEWGKQEMRDMTRAGRRKIKAEKRKQFWRSVRRGERGGRCFNKRVVVAVCFSIIVVLAVTLGICIPRVPDFNIDNDTPLTNASGAFAASIPTQFTRVPANFSFPAFANLQVDTTHNYLPLHFRHLRATVHDIDSGFLVATGDLGKHTVPAKGLPEIQLPLNFTYLGNNDTDATWTRWYDACKNKAQYANGTRPTVRFTLSLEMSITGLVGKYGSSTTVNSANCPIELSNNAG
ncbi:hypothetical protein MKEN_00570800 [Mycena kentingensis (nom. inval.)]|nr:hypothetical protein MKEN_00570800 [Mycena kentingensis (nom. inval.)]